MLQKLKSFLYHTSIQTRKICLLDKRSEKPQKSYMRNCMSL